MLRNYTNLLFKNMLQTISIKAKPIPDHRKGGWVWTKSNKKPTSRVSYSSQQEEKKQLEFCVL